MLGPQTSQPCSLGSTLLYCLERPPSCRTHVLQDSALHSSGSFLQGRHFTASSSQEQERMDLGLGDSGPRGRLKEGGGRGDRVSWGPPPMAVDAGQALTASLQ